MDHFDRGCDYKSKDLLKWQGWGTYIRFFHLKRGDHARTREGKV
jgi:hypothetical protein